MNDVMKIAEDRRKHLASEIEKHEATLSRLRDDLEALDVFVSFADELVHRARREEQRDSAPNSTGKDIGPVANGPDLTCVQPLPPAKSA